MDITIVSDLHGHYPMLDGGDLLLVAGDFTGSDEYVQWLEAADYAKKVVVCGNHDNNFDASCLKGCDYLCDSGTEFEGYKIWGAPWTKTFPRMNPQCKAFTLSREEELAEKWQLIPPDTDILVTHCPPLGKMDKVYIPRVGKTLSVGSVSLAKMSPPGLVLHAFGHIHEGYGMKVCCKDGHTTLYINASHVDADYRPVNKPMMVML